MKKNHSLKRESLAGRWIPAGFYSANIITWFIIGVISGELALLLLVLFPLPALILYVIRTKRKIQ